MSVLDQMEGKHLTVNTTAPAGIATDPLKCYVTIKT